MMKLIRAYFLKRKLNKTLKTRIVKKVNGRDVACVAYSSAFWEWLGTKQREEISSPLRYNLTSQPRKPSKLPNKSSKHDEIEHEEQNIYWAFRYSLHNDRLTFYEKGEYKAGYWEALRILNKRNARKTQ